MPLEGANARARAQQTIGGKLTPNRFGHPVGMGNGDGDLGNVFLVCVGKHVTPALRAGENTFSLRFGANRQ